MKRVLLCLLCAALTLGWALPAAADYDPDTDYMAEMMDAAVEGDVQRGLAAQEKREEKIAGLGLAYVSVDFEELYLLSKIIYAEAGSYWLSAEWKMCVGEVVLNRVDSPEFPDTVREVLEQPGQYYGKGDPYFENLKPSMDCVSAAKRLLEGERVMNEPAVVFQSNFPQGSGIYLELKDQLLGSTYLCYSSHMEVYEA